ncbi:UDP-forming cellulose synthase catalytic subunit [filamentous cyanobacterium LEGE 11480]|uniref:Cellulose synthase catalytic subunit [UDP-forming] n=1 Tax=Romeriopsis navalis LEGE 11480 TaxID=2777977 RepID=A0A928VS19_9CYAN|nr:UDP-forming cellulose synthase catalytic subunit [Romeriopsis navalis]MBE9031139.1 UDP-forming cellulose synthase catalytic subunit [Romeriopsis navalis LEGE 11480]
MTPNKSELPNRGKSGTFAAWLVDLIPNIFDKVLAKAGKWQLFLLMFIVILLSIPFIVTPVTPVEQGIIGVSLTAFAWLVTTVERKQSSNKNTEYLHLFLVWLSLVTTFRYLFYRTNYTLNLTSGWVDATFSIVLYVAELYAIMTLGLSFFQTLKLKDRKPIDISGIPTDELYSVDIYIPTYSEDVEIVRKTVLGALAIDYPAEKKRVYVLDDGRAEKFKARRAELIQMCQELGCEHLTRDNNDHAKAGNINTALRKTPGELVLILDCDHIPSRNMLQETVGFFSKPVVSLVQTPHWFYNPDPFERNLQTDGEVPVGNELFYKVIQKGNDFWNAAFFCGSAAIVRKSHLLEIGGIAVETVTEDCHTSLRLHSKGYESVYYDKIMVAGLAPEKFSAYVGQQVRWARGMAQILRLENPLFNPRLRLSVPQRICYFSATSHFFFGFPRLMYAIAPALFLVFGINPIRGLGLETLAYALPHFFISTYANYITYKHVRFSFWNEIYEFAMSFQAGIVTFLALVNPKLGSFNVTDKGQQVTKRSFDWTSSKGLVFAGALVAASIMAVPFWLILRPESTEAVLVNVFWSIFNLLLIISALMVAFEQPQLRRSHRLDRKLDVLLYSEEKTIKGRTINVSETGCQVVIDSWADLLDEVDLELIGDFGARAFLKAQVIRATPMNETELLLSLDFVSPTQAQFDALNLVIYSDVEEWYSQRREAMDDPMQSFKFLASSVVRSFQERTPASNNVRIRKQIKAHAQVYWKGSFYGGRITEIGNRSLRIEVPANKIPDVDMLRDVQPLVGILISQEADDPQPKRLLVQVDDVHHIADEFGNRVALELEFPDQIMPRQQGKIRQLVKGLA